MNGVRLGDGYAGVEPPAGAYWRTEDGGWHCSTPNGLMGNLDNHEVVLHDDGTISVQPSILVTQSSVGQWHGYLTRGVWREC